MGAQYDIRRVDDDVLFYSADALCYVCYCNSSVCVVVLFCFLTCLR